MLLRRTTKQKESPSSSPTSLESSIVNGSSCLPKKRVMNRGKPIPFLRRLRDMLVENEDSISFFPGHRRGDGRGEPLLGRIVIHDRVKVEANVLPRYFNHSSFASLRRQLNYFKFVRLTKKRGNEHSTYVNPNVIELCDILTLTRQRPKVGNGGSTSSLFQSQEQLQDNEEDDDDDTSVEQEELNSNESESRAVPKAITLAPCSVSLVSNESNRGSERLPATLPSQKDYYPGNDPELLGCCHALMRLSGKEWKLNYVHSS